MRRPLLSDGLGIGMPQSWQSVGPLVWAALWPVFLGSDRPTSRDVRRILVTDTYRPDSFTVSERLNGPRWLDPHERDGDAWLRDLVTRRTATDGRDPGQRHPAVEHVIGETLRVLGYRHDGERVADLVWNQEMPYLIDRLIGWCLHGDAHTPNDDLFGTFNAHGRIFTAQFLSRYAHALDRLNTAELARVAVAAGLLGLDRKGGPARCTPIPLPAPTPQTNLTGVWRRLHHYADTTPVIDHLDALLDQVAAGSVRLVWWLDDLIETAFDLLLIQRLATANPRLHVTVVPKNGRHDNDASTADVVRLLRLPAFARLRTAIHGGRIVLSDRGPRMATANPTKLHPSVIDAIDTCDMMLCKGGRVHEMFSGNIAAPMYTAYVLVRPFTEAQAGVDSTTAPLVVFGADPGEWAWWGFQGRADRTVTLPSGRTVPACYTTVADHLRRAETRDPLALASDLADLVALWPVVADRYDRAARAELRLVHDRLAPSADALPSSVHPVLAQAHEIITTGALADAGRNV